MIVLNLFSVSLVCLITRYVCTKADDRLQMTTTYGDYVWLIGGKYFIDLDAICRSFSLSLVLCVG